MQPPGPGIIPSCGGVGGGERRKKDITVSVAELQDSERYESSEDRREPCPGYPQQ